MPWSASWCGMAAMVLTGCHTAPRLGVPTTVYPVEGHCDTSAVVEVGASLPLSGSDSVAGHAQLLGLELGVNGVNAAGGVLTAHRCLELLYKDDRSDPAVDNQALLDLVNQEKVSFLVGPFLALEDPANVDHIGALGTTAGSYSALAVTFKPSEFPNTFPIASSMADQASVLVAAAKRQHLDRVALVRSSSEVAAEGATAFRSDARSAGLTVTATTFVVDSRETATSALTDLGAAHPSAVVVFDSGSTLAAVARGTPKRRLEAARPRLHAGRSGTSDRGHQRSPSDRVEVARGFTPRSGQSGVVPFPGAPRAPSGAARRPHHALCAGVRRRAALRQRRQWSQRL